MMKTKDIVLRFGKILLVFCTLFSQLSFSLEAFAEEVINDDVEKVEETNELTEEDDANEEGNIIEEIDTDTVLDDEENDNESVENGIDENVTEEVEEDASDVSVDVLISGEDAIILGTFSETLTVSMLKESLSKDYDGSVILVLDGDSELEDEDIVTSDMILSIDDNEYAIVVIGDFDYDGIVNQNDVDYIIDDILNGTDESVFDVSDAAYVNASIKNNDWLEVVDTTDVLNFQSSSDANVLVGDTFDLDFIVSGFDKDFIDGIEGIVQYDSSLLELQDVSVLNVLSGNKNEEGKFVYLLEDYSNNDEVLLTFRFKALSEGETSISINDILVTKSGVYVDLEGDNNSIETSVSIAPLGIGGDDDSYSSTVNNTESVVTNVNVLNVSKVTYVVLSSNNYINSLKVKGYDIDFDKYTYEYNVTVGSNVKSLSLDILLDSAYATYVVNGNENFKTGKNVVDIVVTAEDGSTRTYTINVNKKVKEEVKEESKEKSNASRIIIIVLIILVIIGLIYVIFRDDEEDIPKDKKKTDNKKNNTKKKK